MIDTSNREKINIKDKKVTILGLGLSGTSAAKLATITIFDNNIKRLFLAYRSHSPIKNYKGQKLKYPRRSAIYYNINTFFRM